MGKNLWDVLSAGQVDHGELQHIVLGHFPSASQPALREIVCPGDEPHAVRFVFSKADSLVAIEAGPSLTPALEKRLHEAVTRSLLTTAGHRVHRQVFFADHRLTGSWRYRDWFQLMPVPPAAPQLDCEMGDHPFILEVRVTASSDAGITNLRANRAMREVLRLVGGLAEGSVHSLVSRSYNGYWVCLPEAQHKAVYRYPGYILDLAPFSDDFTPPGNLAPVIPSHDLFGAFGGLSGQPLCLPSELTETIDCYLLLDDKKREQVQRACYWVQRANRSFVESFAQSFLAVITVAETLMETGKKVCETCGQNQYKLGTSFATFLDSYVPLDQLTMRLVGHPRSFRERLKALYDSRSKITHGSDLPGRDDAGGYLSPRGNTEENDLRTLLRIMPLAAGAWVRRNASSL